MAIITSNEKIKEDKKMEVEIRRLLGQLGPFGGVEAVDEKGSGRSTWVRQFVPQDHHLHIQDSRYKFCYIFD